MPELTTRQRRHGREIAEAIANLAAKSPDAFIKRELYRTANTIRKHFGYSDAEKESVVLRRIQIGASTVNDLMRETGFPQQDIWSITKKLEIAKLIRIQKMNLSGTGRPACLFFPLGDENGVLHP